MKNNVNMKSQLFKNIIDYTRIISVFYITSKHSLFFITGAKPVLGPNCIIPYFYGIIQLGPKTDLAPVFFMKKLIKKECN